MILVEKVRRTIEKHHMLEKGDRVVVGLSGGADSSALLEALYLLKEQYSLSLFAAHINHGIRGEEGDNDEAFAESLARQRSTPFYALKPMHRPMQRSIVWVLRRRDGTSDTIILKAAQRAEKSPPPTPFRTMPRRCFCI